MSEIFRLIPFSWTLFTCACVYGIALPIYTLNPASVSTQIVIGTWIGVVGGLIMLSTGYYLLKIIMGSSHIKRDTTLEEILDLFDVWFALLTAQTAVAYVPYMFDRVNAYTGISSTESPWYAYLQTFLLICNNFHGASGTNVTARSSFAIIWLSISSILARIFLLIATWFVLRIVFNQLEERRRAKLAQRRRRQTTSSPDDDTGFTDVLSDYVKHDHNGGGPAIPKPSPFAAPRRMLQFK